MENYIESNITLDAKKSDANSRVITYIATKESVDSMGRLFKVAGMDLSYLKKFKSIYWNHNTEAPPIGKAINVRKRKDEVYIDVEFADAETYEFADTIFKLVKSNYINGGSVGITAQMSDVEYPDKPMKYKGKDVRMIVNKSELKEYSITPMPANEFAVPLNAALTDGVINEDEAEKFKTICANLDAVIDQNTEQNTDDENDSADVASLQAKIAELELQLKEQAMEEELETSPYAELYDEFFTAKEDDSKDNDKDSILDEYL